MSPHSLHYYHAEWPLVTEPWINAGGCEPTAEVIWAALLLHPSTCASCSGPLQWISRSLLGLSPRSEGWRRLRRPSWARFQERLDCVQRHRGAVVLFHTHFFVMLIMGNLAPGVWAVLPLHLFPLSSTVLSWQDRVPISAPTPQRLMPTLKSNQHVLQCCWFPPPPLPRPPFTLSSSPASRTDKQMLPRDRFHINDYWLLTPNEPPLSDQCTVSSGAELICLGWGAEAGSVLFFFRTGETPWYSPYGLKYSEWSERRWALTIWSSGGTQQSLAVPWGGTPPNLQTGREKGNSMVIMVWPSADPFHLFLYLFTCQTNLSIMLQNGFPCSSFSQWSHKQTRATPKRRTLTDPTAASQSWKYSASGMTHRNTRSRPLTSETRQLPGTATTT